MYATPKWKIFRLRAGTPPCTGTRAFLYPPLLKMHGIGRFFARRRNQTISAQSRQILTPGAGPHPRSANSSGTGRVPRRVPELEHFRTPPPQKMHGIGTFVARRRKKAICAQSRQILALWRRFLPSICRPKNGNLPTLGGLPAQYRNSAPVKGGWNKSARS